MKKLKPQKRKTKTQKETKAQNPKGPHIVKYGDTLWNISQRYGMKVEELKKLNNITDNKLKNRSGTCVKIKV